jgi:phosphate transport system substrate-binding protein
VTKWSQVRAGWPEEEIKLFGPGTDSGTFDYFTEAINGKQSASRGDYTASEDDNVLVEGVSSEKGALGYFGLAYYEQNMDKLKIVPIANGSAKPVVASQETVQNNSYKPLSRPLFIYVSIKSLNENPEIKKFAEYYLEQAPALAKEVGYVPMLPSDYVAARNRLDGRIKGSVHTK